MSGGNRKIKLRLFKENPHCHWCRRKVILIGDAFMKGEPNPRMATIDHLYSKLNLKRYVISKPNERRKVLSCYECNSNRARKEVKRLSKKEQRKRGEGYSYNPGGKIIKTPLKNRKAVVDRLKKCGIL